MLSRALILATVMLLVGCFAAAPAGAQAQNLEAGKSPSQIFAGTCNACHKSPRGLLKTVPAGSLPGFLRQHYTTSGDMASLLSSFLISNGASDTRYVGTQPKPGKDAQSEAKPGAAPEQLDRFGRRLRPGAPSQEAAKPDAQPQQAAKPDADGPSPGEAGRQGRNAKRLARPEEAPDAAKPAADGQAPAQAASERGPDGRKLTAKQRLSKRGRPGGEEPPKTEAAKTEAAKSEAAKSEAAKSEAAKSEAAKSEAPKTEAGKDEPAKSEAAKDDKPKDEPKGEIAKNAAKDEDGKPEGKSEAAKVETPNKIDAPKETGSGETPVLRADPVPPVTPAPPASLAKSVAVSSGTSEPAAAPPAPAPQAAPPAVTASVPPPEPTPASVAPAGPPAPPISQ
jgi:hypothetical protein